MNWDMGLNNACGISQSECVPKIDPKVEKEQCCLSTLYYQLREWDKKPDYKFAARLLRAFLSNRDFGQGIPYTENNPLDLSNEQYVIDTIRNNNTFQTRIKELIFSELKKQLLNGNQNNIDTTNLNFHLRFNPIVTVPFYADYSGPLGMALGGVNFDCHISDIKFKKSRNSMRYFGKCYNYDEVYVRVKVTYRDNYSFVGSGIKEFVSRRFNVYYSAYILQLYYAYNPVPSKATWEETFIFNYTSYKDSNNNPHFYKLEQK